MGKRHSLVLDQSKSREEKGERESKVSSTRINAKDIAERKEKRERERERERERKSERMRKSERERERKRERKLLHSMSCTAIAES
jgi:hypothetical protein